MDASPERLAVVGQGYVGLPLAMLAIEVGYEVVGIDLDSSRVDRLRRGKSFVDNVSDCQLQAALDTGRYLPTTHYSDAANFKVAVITVPTPLRDRSPDLSYVMDAARSLASFLTAGSLVVLESTTYPGTTDDLLRPILEQATGLKAGADFALAYSPERVDPGNETWTLTVTPKVVAGFDQSSLHAVQEFYGKIVANVVPVSSTRTAEHRQAAQEYISSCQYRARKRVRNFRERARRRRLGGRASGFHQTLWLYAIQARTRSWRPLPADRSNLPVMARGTSYWPPVSLRRSC